MEERGAKVVAILRACLDISLSTSTSFVVASAVSTSPSPDALVATSATCLVPTALNMPLCAPAPSDTEPMRRSPDLMGPTARAENSRARTRAAAAGATAAAAHVTMLAIGRE